MSNDKLAEALRELFVKWLESRSPFRTTVEVEAAWEGWKANTAIAAMLAAEAAQAQARTAQDASKYQELLMAVEKKFPGESRHETALRYIRQAELRSCEPKCDAAMAKESGNG